MWTTISEDSVISEDRDSSAGSSRAHIGLTKGPGLLGFYFLVFLSVTFRSGNFYLQNSHRLMKVATDSL